MIELAILLMAGHIIGDFWLQAEMIVNKRKDKLLWLLIHTFIVALITWGLVGNFSRIIIFIYIFLAHTLIDGTKWFLQRSYGNSLNLQNTRFIILDQIIHIFSIILILILLDPEAYSDNYWIKMFGENYLVVIVFVSGLILAVRAAGFLIERQLKKFEFDFGEELKFGGQTIGRLERLLVFILILAGVPEGIGFLITAKSIFRIGELRKSEHRKQAEYIMIGSLYSFTYAILVAYGIRYLINFLQ